MPVDTALALSAFASLVSTLIAPTMMGVFITFAMEWLLEPRAAAFWRRPLSILCLHLGSFLLLFSISLLLFWRPWFALCVVLAFQLLIVLVNNAKYHSMREPFLIYDFEYFTDAIKHPRLYLPFFGIYKAIIAAIGFLGVVALGLSLEASLLAEGSFLNGILLFGLMALFSSVLIGVSISFNKVQMTLAPEKDYLKVGQVAFIWLYALEHLRFKPSKGAAQWSVGHQDGSKQGDIDTLRLPNVVAVQSESFFDVRKDYDLLKPDVLAKYDQICQESVQFGRLSVPAWGANTIRTESAFLTGLPASHFGVHQFSPYRYFMKNKQFTLAHVLKEKGYRTVCIHPYQANFYMRDELYPQLGFDDFIDINAFSNEQKQGQYTGDVAVAQKVGELLKETDRPLFVFVITMENHGPLHLEQPLDADKKLFYKESKQPDGCNDLTVYARHLSNADQMASMLRQQLHNDVREGVMCWYGDHVPIMADVYSALGEPSGLTDYFVWSSRLDELQENTASSGEVSMDVSGLVPLVLEQVTRLSTIDEKSAS